MEDFIKRDVKELEEKYHFKFNSCNHGRVADDLLADIEGIAINAYQQGLKRAVEEVMREVRIGNLDLSDPKGWGKGYNDCLVKVLEVIKNIEEEK